MTAPSSLLASEGVPLQVLVSASDPDGDPIASLTASPLPAGAAFTTAAGNTSGTLSWQPSFQQAGSYSIVFTATNGSTGRDTTVIDVAESRTQGNDPNAARLYFGVSAATGELAFTLPPNPVLGGPIPLGFDLYYGSLLARTARYQSALGTNWRGTYDWHLFIAGSTAEVEDNVGTSYKFVFGSTGWTPSDPLDYPHQLVAAGSEWIFKHGETLHLYFFDSATGRLTRIQDLPGNQLTLSYNSSGLPQQVADSFGRALTFSYDRSNHVSRWSDGTRTYTLGYTGNLLTSFTDALIKTTNFAYDTSHPIPGLLTSVQDPTGATPHVYQYDPTGRVVAATNAKSAVFGITYTDPTHTQVSNSEGGSDFFTHGLLHRLLQHTDAASGTTSWIYDAQGRVTDVTRPGGMASLHTTYDPASGYPATITYPDGGLFQFTYVARSRISGVVWHRLATQTAPDLTQVQLDYDAVGNVALVTDEASKTWRFVRNASGQPTQVTNPAGGAHNFGYDSAGRLGSHTIGSDVTSYAYDALDRIITVTQPDLSTRGFQYDAMNRVLSRTNELTKSWTYVYRDNGQLLSVDDPLAQTTTYSYDTMNWLTSKTDELGNAESFVYDKLGRRTTWTDRTSRAWGYSYDVLGRLISATNPGTNATSFGWDALSRLTSVSQPLSRTTEFGYDSHDRPIRATNPLLESTTFTFNHRDYLTHVSAPLGYTEDYTYDSRGLPLSAQVGSASAQFLFSPLRRLATYTDGNGQNWTRGYDNRGRLTSQTDPLGRSESFSYDSRDRVSGFTSLTGTASFQRDSASRLTQRSYSDGTAHHYSYDDVGRLLTTEGVTRTYDLLGRLNQENGISFGYDNAGRLTSQTFGSGRTLTYSYDPRGLLIGITDWGPRTTQFEYDAGGRRTRQISPNGLTTRYVYDAADHVVNWNVAASESVASATTTRDQLGRVKVKFPWLPSAPVTPPLATATYAHDAASQIIGYTYDAMGRLLNDGVRTYEWDQASRLKSLTEAGHTTSYTYDGLNRAYQSTTDGVVTSHEYGHAFGGGSAGDPRPSKGGGASDHEVGHWFGNYYPSSRADQGSVGFFQMMPPGPSADGLLLDVVLAPPLTRSADGAWLRVSVPEPPASAGDREVGHWDALYSSPGGQQSGANGQQLFFTGKLKVNGNAMLYTVHDARSQLMYTIGHLNGEPVYHHIDDLGNVAFLSNAAGSIVTSYAYSPTGGLAQLGWTPQAPRHAYRANGPVLEESGSGLYRIGTDLYDSRTARKLPDRLKILPPPPVPGNRLYVGNLSYDTSASEGTIGDPNLFTSSIPSPLELVLLGQVPGAEKQHPDFIWLPRPVVTGEYHPTARYAVQVGWQGDDRYNGRYFVTGARHVYLPSGEGYRNSFTLGAEPPPQSVAAKLAEETGLSR